MTLDRALIILEIAETEMYAALFKSVYRNIIITQGSAQALKDFERGLRKYESVRPLIEEILQGSLEMHDDAALKKEKTDG